MNRLVNTFSNARVSNTKTKGSNPALASDYPLPASNVDYIKFGNMLTVDQLKFRLHSVKLKLDMEKKVKAGTENFLTALGQVDGSAKAKPELEEKIAEAAFKINILGKAEHKYSDLLIDAQEAIDDELFLSDNQDRRTGRIKIKLIGVINLSRKASKDDLVAVIKVDGTTKYVSKPVKSRWDEQADFQGRL
jgi:hypothetical protein